MPITHTLTNKELSITLAGDFINHSTYHEAQIIVHLIKDTPLDYITFVSTQLGAWDSSLLVALFMITKEAEKKGVKTYLAPLPPNLKKLIELATTVDRKPSLATTEKLTLLEHIGTKGLIVYNATLKATTFLKQTFFSLKRFFLSKAIFRKIDFLFALEDCSYKAVGIVSLVSFMVGLILAFVGAIQLENFGAEIYVASLVMIGMTRIMGAIMMGIIMAGRTGASYAATIGTMQVNEEIDALKTMGIPIIDFLVIPRIISLIITMPFLTILADFTGILGGAFVGVFALGISAPEYWQYTIDAFSSQNFVVGLFHSVVYGAIIAICGCYYGINCGRDADSVGVATTKAVVSSIVWMIVATGILTVLFEAAGI